ncbi:MAG TPA: hypothetical protein VH281_04855 [Gaiellaceae bacterium]
MSGAIVVGAIVLLVAGQWAWGIVALLGAAVVFLATRTEERRAASHAVRRLGARLTASRESFAARSRGHVDLFRARRERAELEGEKTRVFQALGAAVFYQDRAGTKSAKAAAREVVDRTTAKEAEIQALITQTEERVQRAQEGVRPTERLEAPPEPARIPEPWPPPDEGEPPEPAIVPEPSPDEPVPDPEPGPAPQDRTTRRRKAQKA